MFHTLVASGPRARPSARRFLLSISFHGVAVAGAIALSRQSSTADTSPQTQPALVFVAPQSSRQSLPAAEDRVGGQAAPKPSWGPLPQIPDLIPAVVPTTLPSVADLLTDAFFRSGSSSALPRAGSDGLPPPGDASPWPAESVDDPVGVIEQSPLHYPPALALAGITGLVELEYVVDTSGRAEPGSLRALGATHPEFEAAAGATILGSRYRPARLHGKVVRQLVRQTLRFRSER
jgi:outer membrane biosynthesis protein TonB